jgi:predicted RNase H-like nuclease (RuvC/YqgF family)
MYFVHSFLIFLFSVIILFGLLKIFNINTLNLDNKIIKNVKSVVYDDYDSSDDSSDDDSSNNDSSYNKSINNKKNKVIENFENYSELDKNAYYLSIKNSSNIIDLNDRINKLTGDLSNKTNVLNSKKLTNIENSITRLQKIVNDNQNNLNKMQNDLTEAGDKIAEDVNNQNKDIME